MSFTERIIKPTITLGSVSTPYVSLTYGPPTPQPRASFQGGDNTVTFDGLRAHVDMQNGGGSALGSVNCRFYGLSPSVMNQLSAQTLQITGQTIKTSLRIDAGDRVSGLSTIFVGQVIESWVDAANEPDVALVMNASSGGLVAVLPVDVNTYAGSVDVAVVAESLARQAGFIFEGNGVSVIVETPYLWGDWRQQVDQLIQSARTVQWDLDTATSPSTLAIWPKGTARGGTVPLISAATGMVSSPQFNENGVIVTTLFMPTIRFGQKIRIESQVLAATGQYFVNGVWHMLDSQTPGGRWHTTLECSVLPNQTTRG